MSVFSGTLTASISTTKVQALCLGVVDHQIIRILHVLSYGYCFMCLFCFVLDVVLFCFLGLWDFVAALGFCFILKKNLKLGGL